MTTTLSKDAQAYLAAFEQDRTPLGVREKMIPNGTPDGMFYVAPAITDEQVENVESTLNTDFCNGGAFYSTQQVQAALYNFVRSELEALLEDIEKRFLELSNERLDKFLGEPLSRAEEARWERADAYED